VSRSLSRNSYFLYYFIYKKTLMCRNFGHVLISLKESSKAFEDHLHFARLLRVFVSPIPRGKIYLPSHTLCKNYSYLNIVNIRCLIIFGYNSSRIIIAYYLKKDLDSAARPYEMRLITNLLSDATFEGCKFESAPLPHYNY
jgi:hypothetical protein